MKHALWLLLVPLAVQAAEHDHSAQPSEAIVTPEPAAADHSAHTTSGAQVLVPSDDSPAMQEARHMSMLMHGAAPNYLLMADRLEEGDDDSFQWDLQGWFGYDRNKLWLKTEGERATTASAADSSEVQVLYSRAVAPFWDLQAGLRAVRYEGGLPRSSASQTYAVLGVQGLAPYWFDVDAAAFLSEEGELSMRVETEYDLRFTQRLVLQPRVELDYSFADEPGLALGEGLSEVNVGLRLRYELRREFAPYLGLEWSRAYGGTADLLRAAGEEREESRMVAGLRFWY